MKEMTIDERKKLMLNMLDEIDCFCREKNITYYLTGGTLLGAIRHNGFIPWDDDIDIALKRKDYEKLLNEFKSNSGHIEILDYRNKNNFIWPGAKIIDNRTTLIENDIKKASIGVNLDMFPLDYLPGDYDHAKQFVKKVSIWKKILTLKYLNCRRERSFLKNLIVILAKLLYLIPDKYLLTKIDKLSRSFENNDDCVYICNLAGAWGIREIANKNIFSKAENHLFENKWYMIPVGYDEFLRNLYGDYMVPPPLEKRVSTHTAIAFWK